MNWNKMVRVFCHRGGKVAWGNGHKKTDIEHTYRCTLCAELHGRAE